MQERRRLFLGTLALSRDTCSFSGHLLFLGPLKDVLRELGREAEGDGTVRALRYLRLLSPRVAKVVYFPLSFHSFNDS